jgi:hypothetical protein
MPEFETYVDVDVYEFVSACRKPEIKELIDALIEDGHINASSIITETSKNATLMEIEHAETCSKLSSVYHRMTTEECDMLKTIASKY